LFRIQETMAYKGTAAKSASGASMSKYDVEVEARLKALEAKAHEKCSGGSAPAAGLEAKVAELEAKYQKLVDALKQNPKLGLDRLL